MSNIEYKINDLSDLDTAIKMSKDIFHPSATEIEQYHNKLDWTKKINDDDGLLVMAYVDNEPAGFVMCYSKEPKTLHIWVGGVLEKYRGLGIWTGIYEKIESYATAKNHQRLTLNTYKDKFPVMYTFASTHGFHCYKTEIKDNREKSYFERKL